MYGVVRVWRVRFVAIAVVIVGVAVGTGSGCSQAPSEQESLDPKYPKLAVRISNHQYGDANDCTATFSPQAADGGVTIGSEMTCGHPGAVSKLRWKYLHTDAAGDHYNFSRMFPSDAPVNTTEFKDVVYTGKELVVFEDEVQRIAMLPPDDPGVEDSTD